MDKTELIEFVKLFKEATQAEEQEQEQVKDIVEDASDDDNVEKPYSFHWFDAVEDRLFTFLILFFAFIYLYLLATGQTAVLHSELQIFRRSQTQIHFAFLKFFNESYQVEAEEYKAEKMKYEQYAARDELKLDWRRLSESEITCSNDLMKQTALLIHDQIEQIKKITLNEYYKENLVNKYNNNNVSFSNFDEFKGMFQSPVVFEQLNSTEKLSTKLDEIYILQIREYFKNKFTKIHSETFANDSVFMKSKQQLLFLIQLQESLNNTTTNTSSAKTLANKIKTLISVKEQAIGDYETNIKNLLNDLKTTIESIPIYPKMKTDEPDNAKVADHYDHYMTFFEKFYSKLQQ